MQTCNFFASLFFPELCEQLLPFIDILIAFWVKCDVVQWKMSTEIQTRLEYLTISIKLQVCLLPKKDFWLRGTWKENNAPDFRVAFLKSTYVAHSDLGDGKRLEKKRKKYLFKSLEVMGDRYACVSYFYISPWTSSIGII